MFTKYSIPFDLDDPRTTLAHREIILSKPFLKRWYSDLYNIFIQESRAVKGGKYLEVGSGGGFLNEVFPEVITSDIQKLPHVQQVFSAERLPFKDSELASIMMLNVFHHIPNPALFLGEAERTLVPGGKILMVEPANTWMARIIYKNFHHEPFDESGGREIKEGNPLSNSNQALPYIYFQRDVDLFKQNYPSLKIISISYHSPLIYILSGGVSRKAFLPYIFYPAAKALETILSPISKYVGLFCTIKLQKVVNH